MLMPINGCVKYMNGSMRAKCVQIDDYIYYSPRPKTVTMQYMVFFWSLCFFMSGNVTVHTPSRQTITYQTLQKYTI